MMSPDTPFPFPRQRIQKMLTPQPNHQEIMAPPPLPKVPDAIDRMREETVTLNAADNENRERLAAIVRRCEQASPGSSCGTA